MTGLLLALVLAAAPMERWTAVPYSPDLKDRVTPPCKGTTSFGGYCWVPLVKSPPCPTGSVEHEGRCFYPLVRKTAEPNAVSEDVLSAGDVEWDPAWEVVPYRDNLPHRVRPPCPSAFVHEGFCWVGTLHKLPCPPGARQFDGKCFMPIVKPPAKQKRPEPPTS